MSAPRPRFRTRIDEIGSDSARFYFGDEFEAAAFAQCHGVEVVQTSPRLAGGGLWMVAVPYRIGAPETVSDVSQTEFTEQLCASIEIGRAALACVGGA